MPVTLDKTGNEDLGRTLAKIETALNASTGSIDTTGLTVTAVNATDDATVWALANEIKTKLNLLVTRLAAAQL